MSKQRIDTQYARGTATMQRIHSFQGVTRTMEQLAENSSDMSAAGASEAQDGHITVAELQRAHPPATPKGVKREGVGGWVYPPAGYSFPPGSNKVTPG
jgi:hypothetical protein